MGKGRYLKAAERACARKARFETAASAEAFAEYRFKAYLCPVCHHWHLTSQGRPTTEPEPTKPEPPGPKLRDLDWSALTTPSSSRRRRDGEGAGGGEKPIANRPQPPTPPPPERTAQCAKDPEKDGRVLLLENGRLVKSAKVKDPKLKAQLERGATVELQLESDPPVIVKVLTREPAP